jgi:Uma2 family endonuclease
MTATVPAIAPHIEKTYTIEEYFELEKRSEERHEFVNGKLYKMPGESVNANMIADNCGYALRTILKPRGYIIIRHDVRTIVKDRKKYRYPDVAVGKLSEITDTHAMTKPELLIEVSSYQSAKTDNETKVNEYVSMPSVEYYMIVSQYEPLVQLYIRDDQGWRFEVFGELTDVVKLPKLNCVLSLSDIYESIVFTDN